MSRSSEYRFYVRVCVVWLLVLLLFLCRDAVKRLASVLRISCFAGRKHEKKKLILFILHFALASLYSLYNRIGD